MADFNTAYNITLRHEGGYANNPNDKGGETYKGIARNFHPQWEGWKIIDQKKKDGPIKHNTVFSDAALDLLVRSFYEQKFWIAQARGHEIKNQQLANFVFDFVVHSGAAEREINRAINAAAGAKIPLTNSVLTADSIRIMNAQPAKVYPAIVEARKNYMASLDSFSIFGKGWLNRIAAFPAQIKAFAQDADKKKA